MIKKVWINNFFIHEVSSMMKTNKEWISGKLAVQPPAAAEQRLEKTGLRPAVQPRLR